MRKILSFTSPKKKLVTSVYGIPLKSMDLVEGVPAFLPVCCDFIKDNAKTVGIFRINGQHTVVDDLGVFFFDHHEKIPDNVSVHDIASFLKRWVRELPEPILKPSVVNQYFKPNDTASVSLILNTLEIPNRRCLAHIFDMLQCVIENTESNKMTIEALNICFNISLFQLMNNGVPLKINFDNFLNIAVRFLNNDSTDFVLSLALHSAPCTYGDDDKSGIKYPKLTNSPFHNNAQLTPSDFNKTAPIVRSSHVPHARNRYSSIRINSNVEIV